MIDKKNVFLAGKFQKPHGVKGEISISYLTPSFQESDYLLAEVEGLLVPFYIDTCRIKSSTKALVKFDSIDSEEDARLLVGSDLFLPMSFKEDLQEDVSFRSFIGFQISSEGKILGEIVEVDEQTSNVLFIVATTDGDLLLPASTELISSIDVNTKSIEMILPEGLLEMN